MSEPMRVVIVGGGVAGMEVATGLGRSLGKRGTAQITLVDRSLSHVWKPMLHIFAAGTARPDRQKIDFLAHAEANGFRFWPGLLLGVDRAAKQVSLATFSDPGRPGGEHVVVNLPYDALVIAIGSRANDFGTPGVTEYCMTIDDLTEAEAFHDRLRRHVFAALQPGRDLDVAIVGGGATGVELAAELKRAIDLISGYGSPALRQKLRLTLIESGPRVLPAFPDHVAKAATQTLVQLGVDVRTGVMVTGADETGFTLKDGSRIEAELKVWAAGVKAPEVLAGIEGLERSKTGQLVVDQSLQTTRDKAIFALGDSASQTDPVSHRPVPATAQAARQQAQHFSRYFPGWRPGQPMRPFQYREKGAIVSLADYNGWGTLGRYTFGGGRLHGLSARLADELLYRQYQLRLLGPMHGALAWLVDMLDRFVSPPVRLD